MLNHLMDFNNYFLGQMRRIYFMALPENKKDFKKSRICFTTADTASQTIVQLAGGTFLATLMSYSGVSDANIGIITSLASFAAVAQLLLINFFKRLKKYKLLVCATALQKTLFALLYLVPLLMIGETGKSILIVAMYFIVQVFTQIGAPASQDWIASLVPSRLRGNYFSIKDSIAVFVVATSMLICGVIFDYFKTRNMITGFIIISVIIFLLTMMNFIALSMMKEPKLSYVNDDGKEMHGRLAKRVMINEKAQKEHKKEMGIPTEIRLAFADPKFRKAFMLQCMFILAFYICLPFNSSYQIYDLKLPYTFIMIVNFFSCVYRVFLTPKMGKIADRFGMARALRYSFIAFSLNLLLLSLTAPGNAFVLFVFSSFISSTAWSFLNIGIFGVQLDFFKPEKRMTWLSITASITGVIGFITSIIGGRLLSILQKNPIMINGTKIYAQQVLNLVGFLIAVAAIIYIRRHIETVKVDINRQDGRVMKRVPKEQNEVVNQTTV